MHLYHERARVGFVEQVPVPGRHVGSVDGQAQPLFTLLQGAFGPLAGDELVLGRQPRTTFADSYDQRCLGVAAFAFVERAVGQTVNPAGQVVGRQRWTEVVALGQIAAECREHFPGGTVFDAFRDYSEAEVVGKVDDSADDRPRAFVRRHTF